MMPLVGYATAGCLHGKCRRAAMIDFIQQKAIICKDKRCEQWLRDLEEFSKIESFNLQKIAKDYFIDIERFEINKEDEAEVNDFIYARDTKRHELERFSKKYKLYIRSEHAKRQLLADEELKAYEEKTMYDMTRCEEQVKQNKRPRMEYQGAAAIEHEVDDDSVLVSPEMEMKIKKGLLAYIRDGNQTKEEFYDLLRYIPNISITDAEELWDHRDDYADNSGLMEVENAFGIKNA